MLEFKQIGWYVFKNGNIHSTKLFPDITEAKISISEIKNKKNTDDYSALGVYVVMKSVG